MLGDEATVDDGVDSPDANSADTDAEGADAANGNEN